MSEHGLNNSVGQGHECRPLTLTVWPKPMTYPLAPMCSAWAHCGRDMVPR